MQDCKSVVYLTCQTEQKTPKANDMETRIKLAIETYSNLTGKSESQILKECQDGNSLTIEIVQKLMFAA